MTEKNRGAFPREGEQQMSLRERKKRLAQATIEEAALRLFQQQGYEQTSIQDIADAVMMSPRTFFRYFASKEEVIFGPTQTALRDGIHFLVRFASKESPHTALRATFEYLASVYQQQQASLLSRYQVATQTPSIGVIYLYAMLETEPELCEALISHLEVVTNRNEIRFLVAIYVTTFRVAAGVWLENGAQGDLITMFREHLRYFSSLAQVAE